LSPKKQNPPASERLAVGFGALALASDSAHGSPPAKAATLTPTAETRMLIRVSEVKW